MQNTILTVASFVVLSASAKISSFEPLTDSTKTLKVSEKPASKHWYESLQMRGYTQVRYNRLGETNPNLKCEQCDRYWGNNQGVGIRRARLIIFGQVHPRVYLYFQTDAANTVGTGMQYLQVRDLYFDYGLDKKNEFRLRFGQSKVPFGFENLQSSQNRLPLDRADATNSAVSNERDMGLFFMWAPSKTRKLYSDLIKENLKGSGDYGVFAFGFYNGQVANKPELNNNRHMVARLSYPIAIGKQLIEPGIAAYKGVFTLASDQLTKGVKFTKASTLMNNLQPDASYLDQRVNAQFVVYPKPFGIQAEYNIGVGPQFNPVTDSIETQKLQGGYATFSYKMNTKEGSVIPFVRIQKYSGGKKQELDARSYKIQELEIGTEWQINKNFELTAMYTTSHREFLDYAKQTNDQKGRLIRIQVQMNF